MPGFVEHFQNLNKELARVEDHGDFELKDLYNEKVIIPYRPKKQIQKNNRVEMKAQTVVDVIPIC